LRGRRGVGGSRAGISVVEMLLAVTVFSGIGYVLTMTLSASESTHDTVERTAEMNRSVRETIRSMSDELRAARAASVVVDDVGGFDRITFQTAIEGAAPGVPAWGAYERDLDLDEALCHRAGWSVRYVADPGAAQPPALVRQVLDDVGVVQHTEVLLDAVTAFEVTATGDLWAVQFTAVVDGTTRIEEFDVRTRDQD